MKGNKEIYRFVVNNVEIFIKFTDYGELKMGGKLQMEIAHMPTLYLDVKDFSTFWYAIQVSHSERYELHIQFRNKEIWCNIEEENTLKPNDNNFPFFFISGIKLLAIKKQLQELNKYRKDKNI